MAFQVSKKAYQQISPTLLPGYHYEALYHNLGQLQTPYEGKFLGQLGDYAPPQRTRYYTLSNPNYPYVLDKDFRKEEFLPTEGCCYKNPGYFPCYEPQYPDFFVPPNYFAPTPSSVACGNESVKEGYENTPSFAYTRLPVTYPPLQHANDFPPFDKYY